MKKMIFGICLVLITCFAIAQDTSTAPASAAPTAITETAQQSKILDKETPKQLELTPAQSLEILARAAGEYKGTLEEHMILRQAIVTIAKALGLDKQQEAEK